MLGKQQLKRTSLHGHAYTQACAHGPHNQGTLGAWPRAAHNKHQERKPTNRGICYGMNLHSTMCYQWPTTSPHPACQDTNLRPHNDERQLTWARDPVWHHDTASIGLYPIAPVPEEPYTVPSNRTTTTREGLVRTGQHSRASGTPCLRLGMCPGLPYAHTLHRPMHTHTKLRCGTAQLRAVLDVVHLRVHAVVVEGERSAGVQQRDGGVRAAGGEAAQPQSRCSGWGGRR